MTSQLDAAQQARAEAEDGREKAARHAIAMSLGKGALKEQRNSLESASRTSRAEAEAYKTAMKKLQSDNEALHGERAVLKERHGALQGAADKAAKS